MNKKIFKRAARFGLAKVMMVLAIIVLLATLAIPALAQPTLSDGLGSVTNLPTIINSGSVSNITSVIRIYDNSGLSLHWKFNASAGNSNASVYLAPTVDGTNFLTAPWVWTGTANGPSTNMVIMTNWSAAQLRGFKAIGVMGITNWQGGTGIITNKGMYFRRPLN